MTQRWTSPILVLFCLTTLSKCFGFIQLHQSRYLQTKKPSEALITRQASLPSFLENLLPTPTFPAVTTAPTSISTQTVQSFFDSWNEGRIDDAVACFVPDCRFEFASFYKTCEDVGSLERLLRLMQQAKSIKIFVIDRLISNDGAVGVKFHLETASGDPIDAGRGSAVFIMDDNNKSIVKDAFLVQESKSKPGEDSLNLLRQASVFMGDSSNNDTTPQSEIPSNAALQYFSAWNRRDMKAAVDAFADDATYDDTAFPDPFVGKQKLENHLLLCADCFPPTFSFQVDNVIDAGDAVCVKWHVENNGNELLFTRGCSFYELNREGKIQDGIDFVEPAVIKPGGFELVVDTIKSQITDEPARLIPWSVWVAYIAIVFFSDGILPGANALALEQRTWEEVRDLSLNFFLVSPILNLPFAPVVHPMLEGTFNLLLSWAAMFAGFLSDDRKDKPNLLPMLPMVAGMQFLTSAFLLPYLALRSSESKSDVAKSDLPVITQACESPLLGGLMAGVGSLSLGWAFLARPEFGQLSERLTSFAELLSIDRVGSSFLVDLVIFAIFQFWLVDDDLQRRGADNSKSSALASVCKFIPFFGMAGYLVLRPQFPEDSVETSE